MSALQFPCTVFRTQNRMDDYGAKDMRYGDLSSAQLKNSFHLPDVSARVDPWTLTKISPFNQPQSMFYGSRAAGEKITRDECAKILFDELRHLSRTFSFYGPYRNLIGELITHMQNRNGSPFTCLHLDAGLRTHILRDSSNGSSLVRIKKTLTKNLNWDEEYYPQSGKAAITDAIMRGRLPKFDRIQDNFNGMGISIHDTWATHITIKTLEIDNNRYRALVHYKVQDHFGLDHEDILKEKFRQFRFFRIWFVLQRFNQFGFKPFMTNMETTIEFTGERNEK